MSALDVLREIYERAREYAKQFEAKELLEQIYAVLQQLLYLLSPPTNYIIREIDLTTEHKDEEITLEYTARQMVVLQADDTAYVKFNTFTNPQILVQTGDVYTLQIRKIYVTNPASTTAGAKLVLMFLW